MTICGLFAELFTCVTYSCSKQYISSKSILHYNCNLRMSKPREIGYEPHYKPRQGWYLQILQRQS